MMERIVGSNFGEVWKETSMVTKTGIIQELARYLAELFDHEFDFIGNLYLKPWSKSPWDRTPRPTGSVSPTQLHPLDQLDLQKDKFCSGPIANPQPLNSTQTHSRGRYSHTESDAWLRDRLLRCAHKYLDVLDKDMGQDEGDLEEYRSAFRFALDLLELIPTLFPPSNPLRSTRILHHDLHEFNIIIDQNKITGLLDWEYVSVVPVWYSCQLPRVLVGRDRDVAPQRIEYPPWDSDDLEEPSLYWVDLYEHEQTLLRKTFLEEMRRIRPAWVNEYEQGSLRRDMADAVTAVEDGYVADWREWIDSLRGGKVRQDASVEDWLVWATE